MGRRERTVAVSVAGYNADFTEYGRYPMDINDIVSALGSSGALQNAASQAGVDPSQAQNILGSLLAHVNDGGPVQGMVDAVAAKAGVDPSMIHQFLPMVLPLLQGHADATGDPTGGVGNLIGALGGGAGGGAPSRFSRIHLPRTTGDVRSGYDVTVSRLP